MLFVITGDSLLPTILSIRPLDLHLLWTSLSLIQIDLCFAFPILFHSQNLHFGKLICRTCLIMYRGASSDGYQFMNTILSAINSRDYRRIAHLFGNYMFVVSDSTLLCLLLQMP